ncbi:hypothetical protein QMW77_11340, partial [Cronobacter sakazakii]|nr:hypothetical protein [Cronobacter sakazakii]
APAGFFLCTHGRLRPFRCRQCLTASKNNRTNYRFISGINTEENLNSPIHGIRNNLFIDNYFGG